MRTQNGSYYHPLLNIHEVNKASLQANWNRAVVQCQKSLSQTTTLSENRSGRQPIKEYGSWPDYYKR